MADLPEDQWLLLLSLRESQNHGAFAQACDGKNRKPAHALEKAGLADWKGENWGSSFWAITDAGRAFIKQHSAEISACLTIAAIVFLGAAAWAG